MDPTAQITLSRLLKRLESSIVLDTNSENYYQLSHSQYARNKATYNIEQARSQLYHLEKQAGAIRVQSQRQEAQKELQSMREVVKRLMARMEELNSNAHDEDNDSDEDEDESESVVPSYAPARADGMNDGLDTGGGGSEQPSQTSHPEIRSRKAPQASDNHSAATSTARDQLFAGRAPSTLPQNETLLSHNRHEQENLTTSLVALASSLKQSSLQFSSSLESEKDVLKRAEGGLDKSSQGMDAAAAKMGTLRKMSEGQGWWGRVKLYGMIFGLWVVCFVLVFAGPKLRL